MIDYAVGFNEQIHHYVIAQNRRRNNIRDLGYRVQEVPLPKWKLLTDIMGTLATIQVVTAC